MAVARHLAAGAERGIEDRHGHRITIRTADDVAHHGARRGDDGRFGRYLEIASLVERQQVLLLVDRVGHDAGGRVAVGTRQGRSHRVEGGEERLLAIERQFVFERRDTFEQASVFVGQGEEALHAAESAVDSARQPVRLREDTCLREVGGVRIIIDRHRFDDDEQKRYISAPQEFE